MFLDASRHDQTKKTAIEMRTSAENPPAAPFANSDFKNNGTSGPFSKKNEPKSSQGTMAPTTAMAR
ncbi:hypothetical protein FM111_01150 [Brevundimonas diminuta 3F5N]|uniref:Uncharacterized protein n=1 Tax=Brevundimonas diminuta 3F5N TaxID=1255603 RepID=A0A1R4EW99_BREDI|nr:hypothetical protein FM111_01150 [Brevundimonas diminuta 3F5N]